MWPQWALKKAGVRQKEEGRSEDKKAAEEASRRKKELEQAKKEGKDAAWVQTYISLFPMAAQKEQPGEAGTYRGVEEAEAKVRQVQAKLEATTEALSALQAKVEKKRAELQVQAEELLQAQKLTLMSGDGDYVEAVCQEEDGQCLQSSQSPNKKLEQR